MIRSVINVEAPRAQVFQVLTDYARYAKWVPGCEGSTIEKSAENSADVTLAVNNMRRMSLTLRFESDPVQSIRFRLLRSSDVKAYSGTYRLMDAAEGKGTVVVAELEIDAGFMAPKFVIDRVANKALQDTGDALKGHMRSAARAPEPAAAKSAPQQRKRDRRIVSVIATPSAYQVRIYGENLLIPRPK